MEDLETVEDYGTYLTSEHWQERAADIKNRVGKCQIGSPCKKDRDCSGPLHVHHNTYERLGREFDTDLLVLCEYHHGLIHDKCPEVAGGVWFAFKGGGMRRIDGAEVLFTKGLGIDREKDYRWARRDGGFFITESDGTLF